MILLLLCVYPLGIVAFGGNDYGGYQQYIDKYAPAQSASSRGGNNQNFGDGSKQNSEKPVNRFTQVTHFTCVTVKSVLLNPSGGGLYGTQSKLGVRVSNVSDNAGLNPYQQNLPPVPVFIPGPSAAVQNKLVKIKVPRHPLCFANTPTQLQFGLKMLRPFAEVYDPGANYMEAITYDLTPGQKEVKFITGTKIIFRIEILKKVPADKKGRKKNLFLDGDNSGNSPSKPNGMLLMAMLCALLGVVILVLVGVRGYRGANVQVEEEPKIPPPVERITLDLSDSHGGGLTDVRRGTMRAGPRRHRGFRRGRPHERTPLSPNEPLEFHDDDYMATWRSPSR